MRRTATPVYTSSHLCQSLTHLHRSLTVQRVIPKRRLQTVDCIMPINSNGHEPITLVSFDVDGTLIESVGEKANYLHKVAFAHGFKEVFGVDTHIDVIKHHGGTDPLIIIKVLEHAGVQKQEVVAKLPQVQDAMIDCFLKESALATEGLRLLPGVQHLLETLKARDDVATCLVTGNLEPIGWAKMNALGIEHLFTHPLFGGFGTDFCSGNTEEMWKDRMEFVRIAAGKLTAQHPGGIKAHYHVGDTPMDVQAAIGAGAKAIGVTTGIFSGKDLHAAAGEKTQDVVVLDGLSDVAAVIKALGLH